MVGMNRGRRYKRNTSKLRKSRPSKHPSYLNKLAPQESSLEKPQNSPIQVSQRSEWDDPDVRRFENELKLKLSTIFRNAISQVVRCGFSDNVAFRAITTKGFYSGGKDLVSNIAEEATVSLNKNIDGQDCVFENMKQLVEFTIVEIVHVLKESMPLLSTVEAMWWLLMCDLNISPACAEETILNKFKKGTSDSLPVDLRNLVAATLGRVSQEKPKTHCREGNAADYEQFIKIAYALVHIGSSGSSIQVKKKHPFELLEGGPRSKSKGKGLVTVGNPQVQSSTATSVSGADDFLFNLSSFLAAIPYDSSLGQYVPQTEKDKVFLELVSRKQQIETDRKYWIEWGSQKVMQVAQRLNQDKAEIEALRLKKKEGERHKKVIKIFEKFAAKRLSELGSAFNKALEQEEKAQLVLFLLETDNNILKKEKMAAESKALEAEANLQETMKRAQQAEIDAQSCRGQKSLLQEELKALRQKVAKLQQELDKEMDLNSQYEVCVFTKEISVASR